MARYTMIGQMDAPAAREAEFRDYYPRVHISDTLKVPGTLGARMFERVLAMRDVGGPFWKYLVIYEIDAPSPQEISAEMLRRVASGELRGNPELLEPERRTVFHEPMTAVLPGTPPARPAARWKLVTHTDAAENCEAEFVDFYPNAHVPDVLKVPGMTEARMFRRVHGLTDRGSPPWAYMVIYEVETDDLEALAAEISKRMASGEIRSNPALMTDARKAVFYRPVTEPMPGTPA